MVRTFIATIVHLTDRQLLLRHALAQQSQQLAVLSSALSLKRSLSSPVRALSSSLRSFSITQDRQFLWSGRYRHSGQETKTGTTNDQKVNVQRAESTQPPLPAAVLQDQDPDSYSRFSVDPLLSRSGSLRLHLHTAGSADCFARSQRQMGERPASGHGARTLGPCTSPQLTKNPCDRS